MKLALGIVAAVGGLLLVRAITRASSGALYRLSSGYPRAEDWLWVGAIAAPAAGLFAAYAAARVVNGGEDAITVDTAKLARGILAVGGAAVGIGVLTAAGADPYGPIRDVGLLLAAIGACLLAGGWYAKGSTS